jgi:hypothetical protein
MALGGIGGGVYYLVKQNTETKSQSFEERINQVQTKLSEIETFLNKPENADKKLIHSTMLFTLKSSLTNLPSENKEKALKDLEEKIKKLEQDVELLDRPPVPSPDPTPPDPEETVEQLRVRATKEINDAINSSSSLGWAKIEKTDLFNDWVKSISIASDKEGINIFLENGLKDINQLRTTAPKERQKLKDYFVFCPSQELNLRWVDDLWNLRDMSNDLVNDLNKIVVAGQGSWKRKYMAFTGGFNINSENDGHNFDNWVKNNPNLWIAIKKNHNASQYGTERNSFHLKKGLVDYHEFNTRKELTTFLDSNDSYFRT